MTSDAESKLVDTVPLEDSHNNEDGMMADFYINAHHDLDTKDTPPKIRQIINSTFVILSSIGLVLYCKFVYLQCVSISKVYLHFYHNAHFSFKI